MALDPVNVPRGLGVDAWVSRLSTSLTPGHDTAVDAVTGQGAAGVPGACVVAGLARADVLVVHRDQALGTVRRAAIWGKKGKIK